MSGETNLLDFYIGETVLFTVLAKERSAPGTTAPILLSPGTATMTMRIAADTVETPLYTFSTTPEIVLSDAGTSEFTITLPKADIPLLLEDVQYRYDIWTTSGGGDLIHQRGGALVLKPAAEL